MCTCGFTVWSCRPSHNLDNASEFRTDRKSSEHPEDSSETPEWQTRRKARRAGAQTRSARGCHPCLRDKPLPMSPGDGKSVVQGKGGSARVDIGGPRNIKKKK